jgi:hypothetical protein
LVQREGFGARPDKDISSILTKEKHEANVKRTEARKYKEGDKDISSILTKEKHEANVKRATEKKSKAPTKNVKDSTMKPKKTTDEDEEQSDSDSSQETGNSSKRHSSGHSKSFKQCRPLRMMTHHKGPSTLGNEKIRGYEFYFRGYEFWC